METFIWVVNVASAVSVIVLVLLQQGKGADMGAAFGSGASGSLFGSSGSANFLSRTTGILAAVFFISTLGLTYISNNKSTTLPVPMMNIINGGSHSDAPIAFQEFMIMPVDAESFTHAMQIGSEIFHNLKKILSDRGLTTSVGDEGGFAPKLEGTEDALNTIINAIEKAGYQAGKQVMIALDCASSEFYENEEDDEVAVFFRNVSSFPFSSNSSNLSNSAASCTTNAISPVLKVIEDNFGVEKGHIETVHAYTNDQNLIDNYHKGDRRGRAAGLNMVITETGAAKAVAKALPELEGKLTGNAIRVPTPNVSMAILNLNLEAEVEREELNDYLRHMALHSDLQKQIDYTDSPEAVSSDFVGSRAAGVVDGLATVATGKKNCVVYVWYDNEFGYSCQVIRMLQHVTSTALPAFPIED